MRELHPRIVSKIDKLKGTLGKVKKLTEMLEGVIKPTFEAKPKKIVPKTKKVEGKKPKEVKPKKSVSPKTKLTTKAGIINGLIITNNIQIIKSKRGKK